MIQEWFQKLSKECKIAAIVTMLKVLSFNLPNFRFTKNTPREVYSGSLVYPAESARKNFYYCKKMAAWLGITIYFSGCAIIDT